MSSKKQAVEMKSFVPISEVSRILGWSTYTIRRHLWKFHRYPNGLAISRTPGGHLRFLTAAVYWVQGDSAVRTTTADEILADLR